MHVNQENERKELTGTARGQADDDECGCVRTEDGECGCLRDTLKEAENEVSH